MLFVSSTRIYTCPESCHQVNDQMDTEKTSGNGIGGSEKMEVEEIEEVINLADEDDSE